ncbi:MAG: histidine phosphotransferase family protein [Pseudomonadota bacterium]
MRDDPETTFASLLASRLCHDIVNPAGALNTALDVLATETDSDLRQHAESLVSTSMDRLLAIVEFARLAFGASGGGDGDLETEALKGVAVRLFEHQKAELTWTLPPAMVPKRAGRALLNLLLCAERLAPRKGSTVTISQTPDGLSMVAAGPRAGLPDDLAAALRGEVDMPEPKLMPAVMAQRLAQAGGVSITTEVGEDEVTVSLR